MKGGSRSLGFCTSWQSFHCKNDTADDKRVCDTPSVHFPSGVTENKEAQRRGSMEALTEHSGVHRLAWAVRGCCKWAPPAHGAHRLVVRAATNCSICSFQEQVSLSNNVANPGLVLKRPMCAHLPQTLSSTHSAKPCSCYSFAENRFPSCKACIQIINLPTPHFTDKDRDACSRRWRVSVCVSA